MCLARLLLSLIATAMLLAFLLSRGVVASCLFSLLTDGLCAPSSMLHGQAKAQASLHLPLFPAYRQLASSSGRAVLPGAIYLTGTQYDDQTPPLWPLHPWCHCCGTYHCFCSSCHSVVWMPDESTCAVSACQPLSGSHFGDYLALSSSNALCCSFPGILLPTQFVHLAVVTWLVHLFFVWRLLLA